MAKYNPLKDITILAGMKGIIQQASDMAAAEDAKEIIEVISFAIDAGANFFDSIQMSKDDKKHFAKQKKIILRQYENNKKDMMTLMPENLGVSGMVATHAAAAYASIVSMQLAMRYVAKLPQLDNAA